MKGSKYEEATQVIWMVGQLRRQGKALPDQEVGIRGTYRVVSALIGGYKYLVWGYKYLIWGYKYLVWVYGT